ncbi:TetR family transcriptional regulator [Bacteroidia bacterium]|nr:TetR family transcriptional regulator [Bacteroidia bacterium]
MFTLVNCMNDSNLNTEQVILEAAEAEFLEKGYGNTKTVSIAKRAGVSHSMLHYYFRKKENLFQMIFQRKIQTISRYIESILEDELSFNETVRLIIEAQFDFLSENPQLPHFIWSEILSNGENRTLFLNELVPKVTIISSRLDTLLKEESAKGAIRPITVRDFMMNFISINVASFFALPFIAEILPNMDKTALDAMLAERRENNVQFILNALKP